MQVRIAREVALDAAVVLPANMEVDLVRRHVSIVLLAHIVLLMAPSLARFVNLESMVLQLGQRHQLRVMLALLVPRVHLKGRIPLPPAPTQLDQHGLVAEYLEYSEIVSTAPPASDQWLCG